MATSVRRTFAIRRAPLFVYCGVALAALIAPMGVGAQERTCSSAQREQLRLELDPANSHGAEIALAQDHTYEIRSDSDQVDLAISMSAPISGDTFCVLSFDYFSLSPDRRVSVSFGHSADDVHTIAAGSIGNSETFSPYSFDLDTTPNWAGKIGFLHLKIDSAPGDVFNFRNFVLRRSPGTDQPPRKLNPGQFHAEDERLRAEIANYLSRAYPQTITSVVVSRTSVRITGQTTGDDTALYLAEIPLDQNLPRLHSFNLHGQVKPTDHRFAMDLPRISGERDLELARWAIVRKTAAGYELASHAHYPDEIATEASYPEETPRCKRGLNGFTASPKNPLDDLDALGICAVTAPVYMNFFHLTGRPGDISYTWEGHTYYADGAILGRLDQTIQLAASHQIIVSATVLVPQPKDSKDQAMGALLADPDADPSGKFAMPNLATPEGVRAYGGALNFLAERYSRADRKYGRIQHWTMHNEVDAGWVWTNAGPISRLTYMNLYLNSMRMMYLIAKKYNPNASVSISLTHHWAATTDPRFYPPKLMLQDLELFASTEGDFPWAVAYHPYPENNRNPRTWEDPDASYSLDTPFITSKNIEVLNAWAHQPANLYRGHVRSVFLTEQGFNSPGDTAASMTEQAAAMAFTWKKIENLDAIQVYDYHSWYDIEQTPLRLGLRKSPTDADPLGKKPIWDLYRELGTPGEDSACAPYLRVIGIKDWIGVPYRGPIQGAMPTPAKH